MFFWIRLCGNPPFFALLRVKYSPTPPPPLPAAKIFPVREHCSFPSYVCVNPFPLFGWYLCVDVKKKQMYMMAKEKKRKWKDWVVSAPARTKKGMMDFL